MKTKLIAGFAAVAFAFTAGVAMADEGEDLFKKKCGACHALDADKTGPHLGGVMGRKAGSTEFKKYKAFKGGADFDWTPELMDEWITDQKKFLKNHADKGVGKKTGMMVKIKKADERAAIIEYLKGAH